MQSTDRIANIHTSQARQIICRCIYVHTYIHAHNICLVEFLRIRTQEGPLSLLHACIHSTYTQVEKTTSYSFTF